MLLFAFAAKSLVPLRSPLVRPAALPRAACARCAVTASADFDEALSGMLKQAEESGSFESAVESWIDRLDESFIPMLAGRVEAADMSEEGLPSADAPREKELLQALALRSEKGFDAGRDLLTELLGAGEINKMDAILIKAVKSDRADAGFLYVLFRNIEQAQADGDEKLASVLVHLHTRLQEELESRTEPALALLHKLTRLDQPSVRDNVLRDCLVAQTSVPLPGGGEVALNPAVPAKVDPMDFARAIEGALDKVLALPLDRAAIEQTAEEIRTVAKEARQVVADSYERPTLEAFQDALTPAFARSLPDKYGAPKKVDEYNAGA